jgi:hypothetical protein
MAEKQRKPYVAPEWLEKQLTRKHIDLNGGGLKASIRAHVNFKNYQKEQNNG